MPFTIKEIVQERSYEDMTLAELASMRDAIRRTMRDRIKHIEAEIQHRVMEDHAPIPKGFKVVLVSE